MGGPVIRHSDYARSGAIVGDSVEQINAFTERCLQLRKVLGAGVHPLAIGRLAELWPDAVVEVEHLRSASWLGVGVRVTEVRIRPKPESAGFVEGLARCNPGDQFRKARGIDIAYRRALGRVKEVVEGGRAP